MKRPLPALAAGLLLAAAAHAAAAPVAMDPAVQRKLGVAVQALPAARHSGTAAGFAKVLDPAPLASLDADIAAAAAQAQASQAEAKRARSLGADATISAKAVDAAVAQARADASKLALLHRRLGFEWGPTFMAMSEARRAALISRLAAGQAALVRIDAASSLAGVRGATLDLGPDGHAPVEILGPARTGDPRLLSTGLVGLVTGPAALRLGSGLTAPASLSNGGAVDGVLVPRGAVMRSGGDTFVYVRKDAGHFERRTVSGGVAQPEGLFASGGLKPGDPVVVSGAAALFAAETAPKGKED